MTRPSALFLTPGAGGLSTHKTLLQFESEFAASSGPKVVRYDFEYRLAGKRSPGRADRLIGELAQAVERSADDLGCRTTDMVIGGRSMGGRVCTMAVAEGLEVAGLLLLSYPLHPPKKPESLRVDHWPNIGVPSLFISGDNDPLGRPAEFEQHFERLGAEPNWVWLEGGGHDPSRIDHRRRIIDETRLWMSDLG